MSQLYADFLVKSHIVKIGKKETELTPEEIINRAIIGNINKYGTSASVQMLKEIADRTEGISSAPNEGAKKDADLLTQLLGGTE
jgi:hypothetical protein